MPLCEPNGDSDVRRRLPLAAACTADSHTAHSVPSALMHRAGGAQGEKRQLEAYFQEHSISEKLNTLLNEMVQVRPSAPYGWLARRIRLDDCGHTPAVGTVPLLAKPVGTTVGCELEKQWGYCLGLQGIAAPASRATPTGVQLTIETSGKGVLLCIRPDK